MARTKRLVRSFYRLLLPIIILVSLSIVAAAMLLNYSASNPPRNAYLVTPEKYGRLSTRAAQVTEEKWSNADNTQSRGWLLRGTPKSPAVILLHHYGTDRSWLLDLGVKINEATNFTVLIPDMRGHGENPLVNRATLGNCETEDVLAAVEFLRGLKNGDGSAAPVGKDFGIYGVELGAYSGLIAASKEENIKALALDSIPFSTNDLLSNVIAKRYSLLSGFTSNLAVAGSYAYNLNSCASPSLCSAAKSITDRKILMLSGSDVPQFQDSTRRVENCFPESTKFDSILDLPTSGYGINNAPIEQAAAYDQRVIEFFRQALVGAEIQPVETAPQEVEQQSTVN